MNIKFVARGYGPNLVSGEMEPKQREFFHGGEHLPDDVVYSVVQSDDAEEAFRNLLLSESNGDPEWWVSVFTQSPTCDIGYPEHHKQTTGVYPGPPTMTDAEAHLFSFNKFLARCKELGYAVSAEIDWYDDDRQHQQ